MTFDYIRYFEDKTRLERQGRGEDLKVKGVAELFGVSRPRIKAYRDAGLVVSHDIGGTTKTAALYHANHVAVRAQLKADLIKCKAPQGRRPNNRWLGERVTACCGKDDQRLRDLLDAITVGKVIVHLRTILERVLGTNGELIPATLETETKALVATTTRSGSGDSSAGSAAN